MTVSCSLSLNDVVIAQSVIPANDCMDARGRVMQEQLPGRESSKMQNICRTLIANSVLNKIKMSVQIAREWKSK